MVRAILYNFHQLSSVLTFADSAIYGPDAHVFRPERWTDPDLADKVPAPYHFSYGAGSRGCTAIAFSNRILYAIFARLILSFKIRQSEAKPPCLHYIDCMCNVTHKFHFAHYGKWLT